MSDITAERAATKYGLSETLVENAVDKLISSEGLDLDTSKVRVDESELQKTLLSEDPRYPNTHRLMRDNQAELYLNLMEEGRTRWDAMFFKTDFYEPPTASTYFEGFGSRDLRTEQRGGDADLLLVDLDGRNMKMAELKPRKGYEGRFKKKKDNWSRCFEMAEDCAESDWDYEEPELVLMDKITRAFEKGELSGHTSLMPDLYGEKGGYIVTTEEGMEKLRNSAEFRDIGTYLLWDAIDPIYNEFIAENFEYPRAEPVEVEEGP